MYDTIEVTVILFMFVFYSSVLEPFSRKDQVGIRPPQYWGRGGGGSGLVHVHS